MLKEKPELSITLSQRINYANAAPQQTLNMLKFAYTNRLESGDATHIHPSPKEGISMLEYEKVLSLDAKNTRLIFFADSLLAARRIPYKGLSLPDKAQKLFSGEAQEQIELMSQSRNLSVEEYMLTRHNLTKPQIIVESSSDRGKKGKAYSGKDCYTITLKAQGESSELEEAPTESPLTGAGIDSLGGE